MAKLSKKVRKGAGGVVRSQFVQAILRDLIKAALIAAAAKIADSRTAGKAKREVARAVGGDDKKGKTARKRKSRAPR